MGRPPKPVSEHVLNGTYRRDRHGDRAEAACTPGDPAVEPADDDSVLSYYEKDVLDAILASLPRELFCTCDATVLTLATTWGAQIRRINEALRITEDDSKRYRLLLELAIASKNFLAASAKLGLSPVDRARLQVPDARAPDPLRDKFHGVPSRKREPDGADYIAKRYFDVEGSEGAQ